MKKRDEHLFSKLERLAGYGVKLFLNGKPATPDQVARKLARQTDLYEPGFSYAADGSLSECNYVRIA